MNNFKVIFGLTLIFLTIACKKEAENTSAEPSGIKKENKEEKVSKDESLEERQYNLESDASTINWVGSKPAGKHNGKIKIMSGELIFKNDNLVSGKFIIDMKSLTVLDLEGEEKNDLENHLKGNIEGKEDHFFNVDKYPEASFKITSSDNRDNTYSIYGNLTMKNITKPIKFIANIDFSKDLNVMKMTTENFEIDRTKWNIEYMSKSVFDDLKERFIYDEIGLQVSLKASRQ